MRAVVQRVERARVVVGDKEISSIGRGLLILLGVEKGDEAGDADVLLDKVLNLRIFEDKDEKMNLSLLDVGGGLMVVSQFTLLADCSKGRRPSFTAAAEAGVARDLYEYFTQKAEEKTGIVGRGKFQAAMKVELINEGPVTILLDSRRMI